MVVGSNKQQSVIYAIAVHSRRIAIVTLLRPAARSRPVASDHEPADRPWPVSQFGGWRPVISFP